LSDKNNDFKIILIGSSTGGLPVIEGILKELICERFSVLVAQHMPEGYTGMWAERLNSHTHFAVSEGRDGELIKPGNAYIAPGNRHMALAENTPFKIRILDEPPVNRFRPSIDVLFGSAAGHDHEKIVAVMLTGMCDDGVISMLELRRLGFITIAQNRETSVVYGMNREAVDRGAAELILSPREMIEYFNRTEDERGFCKE